MYWVERCITTSWFSVALNGSLHGFFEGCRGVRQGDPLSPYLFVLGMEVLTGILDYGAKGPLFTFHPKCRRESLSHLMFADDVLIFSGANRDSLSIIKQGLGLFQGLSGLEINQDKSEMFSGGVTRWSVMSWWQPWGLDLVLCLFGIWESHLLLEGCLV